MSNLTKARENPKEQLFDEIDRIHAGMLGVEGSHMHMQPMAPQLDRESATIWFFTRNDTDFARDVAAGGQGGGVDGMFCYQAKDQKVQACLHGVLSVDHDQSRIDRYWNPIVAAWYPGGKDDPNLTLIRFDAETGRVWVSDKGALGFGYEVLKANLTKSTPDVGGVSDVNL